VSATGRAPIRTLIVDDEPLAREGVRLMLAGDPDVEVVGEAASGSEAVARIAACRPDVVLLDVQIPDLDGFGVLRELRNVPVPAVIFVTAYDAYALRAFEVRALDYVLKPFGERRLREAVHRANEHVHLARTASLVESIDVARAVRNAPAALPEAAPSGRTPLVPDGAQAGYAERLEVRTGARIALVPVADIDWIEAYDDYARLPVAGRRLLVAERMRRLEASLDPARFVRIHRSALVNVARVRELYHHSHGDYVVVLATGVRLRLTRSRRHVLLKRSAVNGGARRSALGPRQ
jgi:two-component system, LytTR family, response regulator